MKVFLSWSGSTSKSVATAIATWLARTVQAAEPWVSTDMEKGARWSPEIAKRLQESKVAIVCLTRDNLKSPWLLFEAGAMSNTTDSHVCTFLLGVTPTDVEPPLGQFQHTTFEKSDVLRLLTTINGKLASSGERPLPESTLAEVFELHWPRLEGALKPLLGRRAETMLAPERTEREMLQEILEAIRSQERRAEEFQRAQIAQSLAVNARLAGIPQGAVYFTSPLGSSAKQIRDGLVDLSANSIGATFTTHATGAAGLPLHGGAGGPAVVGVPLPLANLPPKEEN